MVEAYAPQEMLVRGNSEPNELDDGAEEVKNADLSPMIIEDDNNAEDEGELFNPQEIDFSEVERLRTKVATLESLLANGAN